MKLAASLFVACCIFWTYLLPRLAQAYEVYETKANIYVLMEYCSGGDLYSRAPYMEHQAADLVTQICSAISHMHKNGVVHRDLKVENIMFESREPAARIKVLDFGLSKKFMPGASGVMTEWVGTVYTMSPQASFSSHVSQLSFLFSLTSLNAICAYTLRCCRDCIRRRLIAGPLA